MKKLMGLKQEQLMVVTANMSKELCDTYFNKETKEKGISRILPLLLEDKGRAVLLGLFKEIRGNGGYSLTDTRLPWVITEMSREITRHNSKFKDEIIGFIEDFAEVIDEDYDLADFEKRYPKVSKRLMTMLRIACPADLSIASTDREDTYNNIIAALLAVADDTAGAHSIRTDASQLGEFLSELVGKEYMVDFACALLVANNAELFDADKEAVNEERKAVIRLAREAMYDCLDHAISYDANGNLVIWKIRNLFVSKRAALKLTVPNYENTVNMKLV